MLHPQGITRAAGEGRFDAKRGLATQGNQNLNALPGFTSFPRDYVTFFADGGTRRLVGLENLNLQRIIQEIEDGTGTSSWVVSGTITEFRGGNYILVSRAMLKQQ